MKQIAGTLRLGLAQFRELEAFAQFGSDLDKSTQAQLNRGSRLVEVLKQGQYQPMSVEKQVLTLYTVTNGYLDDLDISHCLPFEAELHKHFDASHAELLEKLGAKTGLTDELKAELNAVMDAFKEQFKATHVDAVA
jgi:F-type H+-transporting ATPase subunit alpha